MNKVSALLIATMFAVACGPIDEREVEVPSQENYVEVVNDTFEPGVIGDWNIEEPLVSGDLFRFEHLSDEGVNVTGYDYEDESRINIYFSPDEGGAGMVALIFSKSLEAEELLPGNQYVFDYTSSYADTAQEFYAWGLGCTGLSMNNWSQDAPMGNIQVAIFGEEDNRDVVVTSTWYDSYDVPRDTVTASFKMVRP